MHFDTKCIHGGTFGDPHTGAVSVPIYQVSTYKQEAVGQHKGYEYSRTGNPTRAALEQLIADMENGERGFAFASGMAALSSVIMLFNQGDHVIIGDDVYGGTYRVMSQVFNRFGIEATYVDTSDVEQIKGAVNSHTKAVLLESPSNPLMKVTDIAAVAEWARREGLLLIVDNTFMTPYLQRPLDLGAHIVVHSATKYLGGHSDVVAGLVVVRGDELGERLHYIQNAVGGVIGPQDAWLLMRGMKTLALRMRQHEQSARALAEWLNSRDDVKHVYYPGLKSHPGHAITRRQAEGFGGMLSFDVGSGERAERVLTGLRYFTLAESLGAVESLISIPARMTHASIPYERRQALGITDGLIRLSVGVEHPDDLRHDLEQALDRTK